ncbi:transmembrane transport [Coleophoma cylindrospora]|uniref:Transmembrane transport n=1 Tax=Coleophoma cylindrospora TaxID=1849047 RepID=A0A3D8RT26_9HELO|nr:transmembrane transport [Coleophoma cylindrospora]
MAFGVLEDYNMSMVPGTALLGEDKHQTIPNEAGIKKIGGVVLVPQPSDSPNDPLNWSGARKDVIMVLLAFTSGVTTSLGPMINPGLVVIAQKFNVSIGLVSQFIIGLLAFWTGAATFFTAAGASVWGKRPMFVISAVILLATNVWGFFATSFPSLAAMRTVQGLASAPLETLVTSTVSDLYFVHQRGLRLSLWGVMIASGVLLGQVISGQIIQTLGEEFTFGITALIYIPLVLGIFFFVPETAYERDVPRPQLEFEPEEKGDNALKGGNIIVSLNELPERRESFASSLRLFRGRISDESFWKLAAKPLPLIAFPAVVFSTFIYGSFFAWLLVFSIVSVTIYGAPPYNLNPAQVGLTNLPLLFVGLIASPLSGWLADLLAKVMSRENKGIYEPEFRLLLMIPAVIFSTAGFLGFGFSIQQQAPIIYPIYFQALHSISIPFASAASFTYVIDCHPKNANQAFVTINFAKAVFTFIATTFVNQWLVSVGAKTMFFQMAGINFFLCMLTLPMYVFVRSYHAQTGIALRTT